MNRTNSVFTEVLAVPLSPSEAFEEDMKNLSVGGTKSKNGEEISIKKFDPIIEKINAKESQKVSFVWTSGTITNYLLTTYLLQNFIREFSNWFWFQFKGDEKSIQIEIGKTDLLYATSLIVFEFQGRIFSMHSNVQGMTNTLSSSAEEINDIGRWINKIIKENNHLQGNVLFLDGEDIMFRGIPDINFEKAIFPKDMKQDIIDNTIYHIKNMEQSNGIIFHGPPGTGKSLLCSAIINAAHEQKTSIVYAATLPEFNGLEELIDKYLGDTIVILEDVDAYAFSREKGGNVVISKFLQFMNGIAQRENRVIVVATTNYLAVLDKAIGERPVRFNRKFFFDYPKEAEIDGLVRLYIGDNVDPSLCYNKKFTGAHLAEVRRTIDLAITKSGTSIKDEYEDAVKIVAKTFSMGLIKRKVGFGFSSDEEYGNVSFDDDGYEEFREQEDYCGSNIKILRK